MDLKEELYDLCVVYVKRRQNTVTTIIRANQKALTSETKSSAGDKHETGRAMLQLEMEKASQQLHGITQMRETLAKINTTKQSEVAHLGSIIETNKANYFLSISAGLLSVEGKNYFAISVSSPIGKLLLGKVTGAIFSFNGDKVIIKNIL